MIFPLFGKCNYLIINISDLRKTTPANRCISTTQKRGFLSRVFAYASVIYYICSVMTQQDEKWMREALREALAAKDEGEIPIGAVVVWNGRIIGRGHNMTERLHDATAHAEMIAVTSATQSMGGKYLADCTLYVTVEPCPMCAGALNWSQVGRIVYGAPDPRRGYTLFSPSLLHPKTNAEGGVLADDCSDLMLEFFKNKR